MDALPQDQQGNGDEATVVPPDRANSKPPSPWNSLEIAKIAVSTSTTVAIFIVGYLLQAQQTELSYARLKADREQADSTVRFTKFLDKRAELWDQIGPVYAKINLLVTANVISEKDKAEIETLKNRSNELIVTYQLYFSANFIEAIEMYDDQLSRRLDNDTVSANDLWNTYKAIRRIVAKDMSINIDDDMMKLDHPL